MASAYVLLGATLSPVAAEGRRLAGSGGGVVHAAFSLDRHVPDPEGAAVQLAPVQRSNRLRPVRDVGVLHEAEPVSRSARSVGLNKNKTCE